MLTQNKGRILNEIDEIMIQQLSTEEKIHMLERTNIGNDDANSESTVGDTDSSILIQVNTLNYIIMQRIDLIRTLEKLEEEYEEKRVKLKDYSNKKRKSFLTSSTKSTKKLKPKSGSLFGEDIESIVNSYRPSTKKPAFEKKEKKYQSAFELPELIAKLPNFQVEKLNGANLAALKGPGQSSAEVYAYKNNFCCKTVSTFANRVGYPLRDGDPIHDRYAIRVYSNRFFGALSHGFRYVWNLDKLFLAAKKSCKEFTFQVSRNHKKLTTIHQFAQVMLQGFCNAHHKLIGYPLESGLHQGLSTSMNGHLLIKVLDTDDQYKWFFLCCTIGGCHSFRYSAKTKTLTEITKPPKGTHPSHRSVGSIGVNEENKDAPDIGNLEFYWEFCDEDDFVFLLSDGAYCNYLPKYCGHTPKDFNISTDSWEDLGDQVAEINKKFIEDKLTTIINSANENELTAPLICKLITDDCYNQTNNIRQFLVENPNTRPPKNSSYYAGIFAHVTVVCYKASNIP